LDCPRQTPDSAHSANRWLEAGAFPQGELTFKIGQKESADSTAP
jgi:hypothetical protein